MELVFLGTAGAETTPKVGCLCRVCQEARLKGGRFVRNGPSVFLAEASVLFDTPEDADKSLERESRRWVFALDDTKDWKPSTEFSDPDLLVLETGWFERDPGGRVIVPPGHPIRNEEASFEETLDMIDRINPQKTVLTHIEQLWARSYEDYLELEKKHHGHKLQFAYDGLRIKL